MLNIIASVLILVFLLTPPAWANELNKPRDKRNYTVTDAAKAGEDFFIQGEYQGSTFTPRYGHEPAGLQVIAWGDGQFRAVQYRGGFPGMGWNRADQLRVSGARADGTVRLGDDRYRVTICDGVATLRNSAGQMVGRLHKLARQSPTYGAAPPPGADVLFDGSGTKQFNNGRMTDDGLLIEGAITKQSYRNFTLHLEFRIPYQPYKHDRGSGNSGIYLQERYEVQIVDSFGLALQKNDCGSIYQARAPDVNASLPPLSWQTFDIGFRAARWDEAGKKTDAARITVLHNGTVIHNDVAINNKTGNGKPEGPQPRPILFQDHGNPVRFRNIWIVEGITRPLCH